MKKLAVFRLLSLKLEAPDLIGPFIPIRRPYLPHLVFIQGPGSIFPSFSCWKKRGDCSSVFTGFHLELVPGLGIFDFKSGSRQYVLRICVQLFQQERSCRFLRLRDSAVLHFISLDRSGFLDRDQLRLRKPIALRPLRFHQDIEPRRDPVDPMGSGSRVIAAGLKSRFSSRFFSRFF